MSNESILDQIRQDAQKALIRNAFFRLESALVLAGTIILSVFNPLALWPWWVWTILGLAGEAAVVISSLTDKGEMRKVMESLFREKYNTSGIRDRELRGKLDEAEQYRQRIQQVVEQQPSGLLHDRMAETTAQIYDWIANMVRLARRIDTYRQDTILRRDIQENPKEIRDLIARLKLETNPQIRRQMETTLASKQQLETNLQELEDRMERADLQLDHSLASLGTVYAQTLLIGSKDVDSDRAERLRSDIRDEVSSLQDVVESLNEVYGGGYGTSDQAAASARRASATLGQGRGA
jgi:CII-binding regulator of phage lambda lysogenization HflD